MKAFFGITVAIVLCLSVAVVIKLSTETDAGMPDNSSSRQGIDSGEAAVKLYPVVHVDATEHDFGVMNPNTEGEWVFSIENRGEADLHLTKAGKTCHCTTFEIASNVVRPGEKTEAKLTWNTIFPADEYRHGATLSTNDPNQKHIKFRVNGRICTVWGGYPAMLTFRDLEPDHAASRSTLIYSQVWDDMEVVSVESSLEPLSYEITPANESELSTAEASSAYRLTATMPDDLPQGNMRGWIKVLVRSPSRGIEKEVQIDVLCNVLRRLSVYGKGINYLGEINLGMIDKSEGKTANYVMRVRDPQLDLGKISVTSDPDFLEIDVVPLPDTTQDGIYQLRVSVPAGKAHGNYLGHDAGKFQIRFDHPRIEDFELRIAFAILDR